MDTLGDPGVRRLLVCHGNHPGRDIGREHVDAALSQAHGVLAGAAAQVEDAVAPVEGGVKVLPDGGPQETPERAVREDRVVSRGCSVEGCGGRGHHCPRSTSCWVTSIPSRPMLALTIALARRR